MQFFEFYGNIKSLVVGIIIIFISLSVNSQTHILDTSERKIMTRFGITSSLLFGTSFLLDKPIQNTVNNNRNSYLDDFTNYANYGGSKKLVLPMNALLLSSGFLFNNETLKKTSWNAFKSIGAAALATEFLKLSLSRARPYKDKGPYHFAPIAWQNNSYKSLPSGHTSLAFAFITPYAEEYSRWLYAIPFSVAFSRVYKNDHWTSDVVLGSIIGFTAGYFFHYKDRHVTVSFNKIVIRF
jgi:membrane-associated phospholipid phosphatase